MSELVFATGNRGKVAELDALLAGSGYKVIAQSELGCAEVDETGLTFVENALLKARHAASHTGRAAIADDSGLAVDALRGAPGIYSARYAGPNANDAENVARVLGELHEVPPPSRTCRFICVLVYLAHADDPIPLVAQGVWEGAVTDTPRGTEGFGYDPVFWVPTECCTAAELSSERKNVLSHRGQALRALVAQLKARR